MTQLAEDTPEPVLPALELVFRGKTQTMAYACPKCGTLFVPPKDGSGDKMQEAIDHCRKHCVCGKPLRGLGWTRCDACRAKLDHEREQARFAAATKVTLEDYTGEMVYWDEEYYTVEDLLDHCEDNEKEVPLYVWACKPKDFTLDAVEVVSNALEYQQHHEDAGDRIDAKAYKTLQDFLGVWAKEQGIVSYFQDMSCAVVLRAEDDVPVSVKQLIEG